MPVTNSYKPAGNTIGLSVANSSHAAVLIEAEAPEANALLFVNTSTSDVMYVEYKGAGPGATSPTAPASTVPGDGTKGSFPVLSYNERVIYGVKFPCSVTAISSIAGPTLMTVTPVVAV